MCVCVRVSGESGGVSVSSCCSGVCGSEEGGCSDKEGGCGAEQCVGAGSRVSLRFG